MCGGRSRKSTRNILVHQLCKFLLKILSQVGSGSTAGDCDFLQVPRQ